MEVIFYGKKKRATKTATREMMCNYLKNNDINIKDGTKDILIACVDGLNGFPQSIETVYPKIETQQSIIHQIRDSTKFVSYKDIKNLMAD